MLQRGKLKPVVIRLFYVQGQLVHVSWLLFIALKGTFKPFSNIPDYKVEHITPSYSVTPMPGDKQVKSAWYGNSELELLERGFMFRELKELMGTESTDKIRLTIGA